MPPPFGRLSFTAKDINPYISPMPARQYQERLAKDSTSASTPIDFTEVIHMPDNHGGANWARPRPTLPRHGLCHRL